MSNRMAQLMRLIALLLLFAAVILAVRSGIIYRQTMDRPAMSATKHVPEASFEIPAQQPELPADAWSAVVGGGAPISGQSHERYRLAGTFFLMGSVVGDDPAAGQRLAIVDDVTNNRQYIVSEGQDFEGYEILRIHQDRLIMRKDGLEIELTLSFREGLASSTATQPFATNSDPAEVVLESSRFGKRIGESRWVMQKEALVGYYHELLDHPERIAAIYMSMKPDYIDGDVAGYRLEKEGEADFFDSVGLKEGDTIRKVNSMNMTSQARAEYFISEFMQERLGAVVLDIERNGQPEKLIYLFR